MNAPSLWLRGYKKGAETLRHLHLVLRKEPVTPKALMLPISPRQCRGPGDALVRENRVQVRNALPFACITWTFQSRPLRKHGLVGVAVLSVTEATASHEVVAQGWTVWQSGGLLLLHAPPFGVG